MGIQLLTGPQVETNSLQKQVDQESFNIQELTFSKLVEQNKTLGKMGLGEQAEMLPTLAVGWRASVIER